jgi:hypothetical protein
MMVYKFMPAKWAKVAVRDQRLRLSIFSSLNDPFELSGFNLRDPAMRAFHIRQQQKISSEYGVISFSEDYRSPLMWSHYAEQHAGICLGFDVPEEMLLKVRYRKDRIKLNRKSELTKGDVISLLTVKFSEWRYERERRIMTSLRSAVKEADKYFEPFYDDLQLREILLGLNCPHSEDVFKRLIEKKYINQKPIHIHKLSLAVTKFGITKTIHKLPNT